MKKKTVIFTLAVMLLSGCADNSSPDLSREAGEERQIQTSIEGEVEQQKQQEASSDEKTENNNDNDNDNKNNKNNESNESNVNIKEDVDMGNDRQELVYGAEELRLLGGAKLNKGNGTAYIDGITSDDDGVEVEIEVPQDDFYDINVISKSADGSHKENYLLIDGENAGTLKVESREFTDSKACRVYLEKGVHTVALKKFWGWIQIEKVCITVSEPLDDERFAVEPTLVNPNASDNARRLMKYMCDIYGTDILSGQYCDKGMYGLENQAIYNATGKYPAILGLDMMDYSLSRVARGSVAQSVEQAIEYWDNGGIVTFCWHWNAPEKYLTGVWYSGFYTEHTNIDLAAIMDGSDEDGYRLINEDIDAIAAQLTRLKEAGVPVLWRPLHEASGGWFWWGASGAEAYKKLYALLYDRLTNEYRLDNLIWLWNGQNKDWYPGDEYVDIIGEDIYPGERVYTPQTSKYLEVLEYTDAHKMIVLSENGCLFDPDLATRDGAMWGHFATWNGEFVIENNKSGAISEKYTELEMLKKVYGHEHVITRDELPDLKNYPLDDK